MVEVGAQTMSIFRLLSYLTRPFQTCQDKTGLLREAIYLLEDQMVYRTHNLMRQIQATSAVVDEEVHGTMETVDLADIEVVRQRTEYLYGHARRKYCMAGMGQASDPGLMTHNLKETCEEAPDRQRGTSVVELALRGEIRVLMNLQETREDLGGTKDSTEIGGWSLIKGTAETEEMAVEAEESADEVGMKAKESEALQKTKDRGDDLLKKVTS